MLTNPSKTIDDELPQGRMLTEEEAHEMKENLARGYFDMSLDEFAPAWKAGKFDNDQDKHEDVVSLAMMLPEYWTELLQAETRLRLSATFDRAYKGLCPV